MNTRTRDQKALELSGKVASLVLRAYPWQDREDLTQEAVVAVLRAAESYNPRTGVPFGAYAWCVALRAVSRYASKDARHLPDAKLVEARLSARSLDPLLRGLLTEQERRELRGLVEEEVGRSAARRLLGAIDDPRRGRKPREVQENLKKLRASPAVQEMRT